MIGGGGGVTENFALGRHLGMQGLCPFMSCAVTFVSLSSVVLELSYLALRSALLIIHFSCLFECWD